MRSVFNTPFNLAYGDLLERSRAEAIKARQTEPLENAIQSINDIIKADGIDFITLDENSPQGLHRVQECIGKAKEHFSEMKKIQAELQALRGKPNNADTDKEFSSLNDKLKILQEGLRKEALIMIKSLKGPHLHPFFAHKEWTTLKGQINRLRTRMYSTHFGESRWANWFNNPTLTDKKWAELTGDFKKVRKDAENPEDCIVFTHEKGRFFSKQHTNINLSLEEIFMAVDFMKNAERYIALWKGKLEELKKDPHNPELQKYAKYEPLLKHLEECIQKGFTGLEKNNVTENIFDDGYTIHCGTPEGKQAQLRTMELLTPIVKEEKKENKAAFGAELLQPELENTENLDDAVDNLPRPQ